MNKYQLTQIMDYLDAEYAGIVSRMTDAEKKARTKHWAQEIGPLDFDAVMDAVRKLSRGQFMPRTAEVIAEVETVRRKNTCGKPICRIFRDAAGHEILDLRYSDGSDWITGYLDHFPEWMQAKFRWMADPTPENTAEWDRYMLREERTRGTLMAMEAA